MPLQLAARASKTWKVAHNGRSFATMSMTSSSGVKRRGIASRRSERSRRLKMPTTIEAQTATLAAVFAGTASVAPMRLAMRVEAATLIGKGIWKVIPVMDPSTDCAASSVGPSHDELSVRISKARNSASTMTRPGSASFTMGIQFLSALLSKPPQHWYPSMNLT